jgi:hypothetical protein
MRTETGPTATAQRPTKGGRRGRGALAGLLACGAALGVAELLAGFAGGQGSPLVAVGGAAIDATPEWLKSFAIRTFGERDKLVLLVGIAAVLAGMAAVIGLLAVRRPRLGLAGVATFGAVGAAAALTRPGAGPLDALPSVAGALAGTAALAALVRAGRTVTPSSDPGPASVDRRRFLVTGMLVAGGAVAAGAGGGCWRGGRTWVPRGPRSGSRGRPARPGPWPTGRPSTSRD